MELAERVAAYDGVLTARFRQAEQDRTRNMPDGAVEVSPDQMLALIEGR